MERASKIKGVILAGGMGARLHPLTAITNKHLLPVYDKPMILYPLETLKKSGISEIMIVCGKEFGGHFMNFLGSGKDHGVKLSYALQHGSGGIAEALSLAEDFIAHGEQLAVILGDNIFEDNFSAAINSFQNQAGAKIFIKKVPDPHRFGVAEIEGDRINGIEEKPKNPKSNFVTVGFYLYNKDIFDKIRKLNRSARGELEITDAHNIYIKDGAMSYAFVGGFWSDAGTLKSLLHVSNWAASAKKI